MNTTTALIPHIDVMSQLRLYRQEIVELLRPIHGECLTILADRSSARRCDLFDVEIVVDSPHVVDLMKILRVETQLECLLRMRVYVHHLAYDCEYHCVVRKDSVTV